MRTASLPTIAPEQMYCPVLSDIEISPIALQGNPDTGQMVLVSDPKMERRRSLIGNWEDFREASEALTVTLRRWEEYRWPSDVTRMVPPGLNEIEPPVSRALIAA